MSLIEPTVFGREGFFMDPDRFEEIWLLAKDMIFAPMLRTIHRCAVHEVPYLWSPRFLEQTIQSGTEGGQQFGYRPGSLESGQVRPAIFEPNISPIKMGLIPFMICEAVERLWPSWIDTVTFLNGDVLAEHVSYIHFMRNSALYERQKTRITGRDYFAHVMGRGSNMVVSHQINCAQNYLYLDALYGSYPLIHNSKIFENCGYYYDDSDIAGGAQAMVNAIENHDRNLSFYQARSRSVIDGLSPTARNNIDNYARRLVTLMGADDRRKSA